VYIPRFMFWGIIVGLLFISASILMSCFALIQVRDLQRDNTNARCAQLQYYQDRTRETETYIQENPGPEPIKGISRESLLRSLEAYRQLIDALGEEDCP
jgi:hypothetical protein